MKPYLPEQIVLEAAVAESPITAHVLSRLPDVPVSRIESTHSLLLQTRLRHPGLARAKKSLVLARHEGAFFRGCPAASAPRGTGNVCCNYYVINFASNCHMECTYCYLQSYLNFPYLIVYANVDDLLGELSGMLRTRRGEFLRIGTGELADSLALDPLTRWSVPLVEFFARQAGAVLEFKTKSDCIQNLLGLDHREKTVVSWSLNPDFVQRREEHKTATLEERLGAAERCVEEGYPVAFHFDPLVHYERWERDYRLLVEEVFDRIPARRISWVSLGSLRMSPALERIMRGRFPGSFLYRGELVPTEDGKLRYFKPIRVQMLRSMHDWIRRRTSGPVYLCMEGEDVWSRTVGEVPASSTALGDSVTAPLVSLGADTGSERERYRSG